MEATKKISVYLFHVDAPKGEIFKFVGGKESEQYAEKIKDGWVDTPAKLTLPENDDTGLKMEDAKNARPGDMVKLVQSYGFLVLTPEQLQAEANKLIDTVIDIKDFTDDALLEEAERRGLKEPAIEDAKFTEGDYEDEELDLINPLLIRFGEEPKSLTVPELVTLGNEMFTLGLRGNMKEATLIEKISAAINGK